MYKHESGPGRRSRQLLGQNSGHGSSRVTRAGSLIRLWYERTRCKLRTLNPGMVSLIVLSFPVQRQRSDGRTDGALFDLNSPGGCSPQCFSQQAVVEKASLGVGVAGGSPHFHSLAMLPMPVGVGLSAPLPTSPAGSQTPLSAGVFSSPNTFLLLL